MEPFNFVHAADLHLDSPFRGLCEADEELGEILRESTFEAFNRVIDLCIDREADFLVVSGDVYDSADRSLRAQLRFRDGLKRLAEKGIPTFVAHGNHDPLDKSIAAIEWPGEVHIFGGEDVESFPAIRAGREVAQVYGISFPTQKVESNLAVRFHREDSAPFAVGVLHCNVGTDTGHENYAPCSLDDLIKAGMDYWALGHVHTRNVLHPADPMVAYPGNTQARSPVECGPHGCLFVQVDANGRPEAEFVTVDSVRWAVDEISVSGIRTEEELIHKIQNYYEKTRGESEGRSTILRLRLTGSTSLHRYLSRTENVEEVLRILREDEGRTSPFVWIDRIVPATQPEVDLDALRRGADFLGELLKGFQSCREDPARFNALKSSLDSLFSHRRWKKFLSPPTDAQLREWLDRAEMLCVGHFIKEDE